MGSGTSVKEEAAVEELANLKVKQVRDALGELLLPAEVINQALQKIAEFGGDIDRIASYAISLPVPEAPRVPQVECIEEHLSDDMASSDEDGCGESGGRWMQLPAQTVKEEPWEDPICKLFQDPHVSENRFLTRHEIGSLTAVGVTVEAEAGCSYQVPHVKTEIDPVAPAAPPASPASPAPPVAPTAPARPDPPPSPARRQALFLDMGFAFDLVDRAFKQHGAEAEDSVLLQFLIDNVENNPGLARHVNEEESDDEAELRARVLQNVPVRSLKAPARKLTDSLDSDSESEIPAMTPCKNWEAGVSGIAKPASTCSREIPENGGHRAAMYAMGFSREMVERAIEELGQGVEREMLMEFLLYISSQRDGEASTSGNREISTLEKLTTEFQFPSAAVEKAMKRCNTPLVDATEEDIASVVDFLAAHMESLIEEDDLAIALPDSDESDDDDSLLGGEGGDSEDDCSSWNWVDEEKGKGTLNIGSKRKCESSVTGKGKMLMPRGRPKGVPNGVKKLSEKFPVENKNTGATGFGLPGMPVQQRQLKEDVKGAPFFYFENVASMPLGEWSRIQTHLFDIKPEFVDAMHFSACRRSRGYIHNLPLEGRKKMIQDPPMTIMELMPQTRPFWPEWDKRSKLNCINTVRASEFCAKRLGIQDGTPIMEQELTEQEKREKVRLCSKWNLVWTSPNLATPVEANEIEVMLGFDKDHSRPILGSTSKYKALGNSFSVYTVAFHFSVLRPLYPKGIKVLSLFSGIGGAEVALHKVGLRLNVVVSVEIEEEPRRVLQTWWALTRQPGRLDIDYHDVRELNRDVLTALVNKYRGFDLIVGGSPCNNLTGNNRHTRTGLEGEHSTMFFEFSRIVSTVRELTINLQGRR